MTFAVWGSQRLVRGDTQGVSIDRSVVAALPNGGYVLAWRENKKLMFQVFNGEGNPASAVLSVDAQGKEQNIADITAVGADGDFAISWNEFDTTTGKFSLKTRGFKVNGDAADVAYTLADNLTIDGSDVPAVARRDDDGLVTVQDRGNEIVLTAQNAVGGYVVGTQIATGDVGRPDVAELGTDLVPAYLVTYVVGTGASSQVYYKVIAGGNISGERHVDAGRFADAVGLKNANGELTGGYAITIQNGTTVQTHFYTNTGSFIRTVEVTTVGLNDNSRDYVHVTALTGGRVAVVYTKQNGTDLGDVFLQVVGPDGSKVEQHINTLERVGDNGAEYTPSVTELADGRLVIAWHDDSYRSGAVFTQIFDPRIAPVPDNGTSVHNTGTNGADIYYGSEHDGDVLNGLGGDDRLFGEAGTDTLKGDGGLDSLYGGAGNDTLLGGAGNDALRGGVGADSIDGGADFDIAYYDDTATPIVANLATNANSGGAAGDTFKDVEGLSGTGGGDTLIGDDKANWLSGEDGNDILDGGAGADETKGDTLNGGAGFDYASYAKSTSAVVADLQFGKNGAGIWGDAKGDTYSGVEGLIGSAHADILRGDAAGNDLQGGDGGDWLHGRDGNDVLHGQNGNDSIEGGSGADAMYGGAGDDLYLVDNAADVVSEAGGSGVDTVKTSASYTLGADLENLDGSGGGLVFTGNGLNNTITGNGAGNWIDGGAGADTMRGSAGDDTYVIDNAGDVIEDGVGNDTVILKVAYDLNRLSPSVKNIIVDEGLPLNLTGTDGSNVLMGNKAINTLKGQGGNDTIYGKAGNDKLYGGSGKDVFVFDTALHKTRNVDRVYDFKSKDDSVWLDNRYFTKLGSGSLSKPKKVNSDMFVEGTRAKDREDRIVYDKKSGALYYDKDGTGGSAQVKIATISNKTKLYWHDFYVI